MTGMGRETGLAKDQGQARPGMPGTLNPGGFGAMTAILDVPAQRRRKPRGHNELTGDCRHRDPQDSKSSRNMTERRIPPLPRGTLGCAFDDENILVYKLNTHRPLPLVDRI